jgi:hypothetical protein
LDKLVHKVEVLNREVQAIQLNVVVQVPQLSDTMPTLEEECYAVEEKLHIRQQELIQLQEALAKDWEQLETVKKMVKEFEGKVQNVQQGTIIM